MRSSQLSHYKYALSTMSLCIFAITGCMREKDRIDEQVRQLCAKDGGIKVYEVVKLPPDRFERSGGIRIPMRKDAGPADEYYINWDIYYYKQGNPEFTRENFKVIRRSDGKVLGEAVYYGRGGGDFPGPWQDSSFRCPATTNHPSLEEAIFSRTEAK